MVSGFAGGAETTDLLGLMSEVCLPILADPRRMYEVTVGSEWDVMSQLGVELRLTGDVEGI